MARYVHFSKRPVSDAVYSHTERLHVTVWLRSRLDSHFIHVLRQVPNGLRSALRFISTSVEAREAKKDAYLGAAFLLLALSRLADKL